jgi:hypothetical protein
MWRVIVFAIAACGRVNFAELGAFRDGGDGGSLVPPGATNIVFVTSRSYAPGAFGGLAGADAICANHAAGAGLAGTYVAWLSSSSGDAKARLGAANGWVRPDGIPVAGTLTELSAGRLLFPANLDENGARVAAGLRVVTGTSTDGGYAADGDCIDFSNTNGSVAYGNPDTTLLFSSWDYTGCAGPTALYCFGVDHTAGFTIDPAVGRRAFISKRACGGSPSRRTPCDQACQADAADAGLTGTYLAALALTTEAASARYDRLAATWVRTDGIPLAKTADDFLAGRNLTTLDRAADGTPQVLSVWTGIPVGGTFDSLASENCMEWASSASAKTGTLGAPFSVRTIASGSGAAVCSITENVICLEQ